MVNLCPSQELIYFHMYDNMEIAIGRQRTRYELTHVCDEHKYTGRCHYTYMYIYL